MLIRQLIDFETNTYTYLIASESTKMACIIDPVLEQANRDILLIQQIGLKLIYSIETHVHADHVTGGSKLKEEFGCRSLVPENSQVKCADRELKDGEIIYLDDEIVIQSIATPGHTNSHNAYLINNKILFTGDSLFINGCGRTDFQSGDSKALYRSVVDKLFSLDDDVLVYPGHDYRGFTVSSIGHEKKFNTRFLNVTEDQFVEMMSNLKLPNPKKIMEAVPANLQCGNK